MCSRLWAHARVFVGHASFKSLHWLKIEQRIQYKLVSITYKIADHIVHIVHPLLLPILLLYLPYPLSSFSFNLKPFFSLIIPSLVCCCHC